VARRAHSVGRKVALSDRLARLTFLCSQIQQATKGQRVPTERLRDTLKEVEALSRALRKEIQRRAAADRRDSE
jgi:hypothetical protein